MEVTFGPGGILYRETVTEAVEGVGHFEPLRHYAEVRLLLEPLPRGAGVVLGTRCSEDDLDRNWQRLILTHLGERDHAGVLTAPRSPTRASRSSPGERTPSTPRAATFDRQRTAPCGRRS